MPTASSLDGTETAGRHAFAEAPSRQAPLRAAVVAAYRRPETSCLPPLLALARQSDGAAKRIAARARTLVEGLRTQARTGGVEAIIQEYALSSQEGVALMCLAEALLRIPDTPTRDALIRDKIAAGDWRSHLGQSPSLFVNAATWGLLVTGRLTATARDTELSSALTRLIRRGGEPLIRKGTDLAMRMMGEQYVTGQTIREALANSRKMEARGFRYSYDMLGEAAATAEDAARYLASYEEAIHAIGRASNGRGIYDGPGISIKLSALHPRYSRAKRERVVAELMPRVRELARLARHYDIGMNIDAEEADRLDLSLDILDSLAEDAELDGWDGIGFAIQAYGKRCPAVIDHIVDLARRTGRRLMVRLVKGAYWDAEIKRAQVDGQDGYPVFTRKVYTDVSYLACVRKLLAAPDAIYPQFATHNAQTVASIVEMAGPDCHQRQYEFQCLHGMGEPLYKSLIGPGKLDRPCRIYAPVGTHETLLAYLVRRLLENGANSSFVNRIADERVPIDELIADPVTSVERMPIPGAPHEKIVHPRDLYGPARRNAMGLDLSDENALAALAADLEASVRRTWRANASGTAAEAATTPVRNPADHDDIVGYAGFALTADVDQSLAIAAAVAGRWAATSPQARADCLRRAADTMEQGTPVLLGLIVREAGKSLPNAVAEVREAVDFLRYYAAEIERTLGSGSCAPLGPIACISPWNFPLAIFTGQVAAALAAGNPVLAKPAEETPLIAAEAVRILIAAGIPDDVLQFLPGAGDVGAALVGDPRVQGVMFTGSTAVARLIQGRLAERLAPSGRPVPLIAETGGQNALVADSSALAEQVVADVVASAFDSAGQRCSALRLLCLQDDVADRILTMLKGALRELEVGDPRALSVDVGPVITGEAADTIERHIAAMRARGHVVERADLSKLASGGTFVAPTIIEIARVTDVEAEVFGPVLHVLRYRRDDLDLLIDDINATGYGLTFGVHSRIDGTIARIVERVAAGNIYVNRNIIGATVGVQPFGGTGLSGTGPKAGGPLYLGRLLDIPPKDALAGVQRIQGGLAAARSYGDWLRRTGHAAEAERVVAYLARSVSGARFELAGPVGERNVYSLRPKGRIGVVAASRTGLLIQLGVVLSTGNTALIEAGDFEEGVIADLPEIVASSVARVTRLAVQERLDGLLFEGEADALRALARAVAARPGKIVRVQALSAPQIAAGMDYDLNGLLDEVSLSVNTAAAGGNTSLMAIA